MSQQVTAVNPTFSGEIENKPAAAAPKYGMLKKTVAVLGVAALAGFAGFAAAGGLNPVVEETPNVVSGADLSPQEAAMARLQAAFEDESNPAVTADLTIPMIETVIAAYDANPSAWNDQYMTESIIQDFKTLRDSVGGVEGERRLSVRRELDLSSEEFALARESWNEIQTTTYPSPIYSDDGEDKGTVYTKNGKCFVIAEETSSDADWDNNKKTGIIPVLSLKTSSVASEALCGCKSTSVTGNYCAEANVCAAYTEIGEGFRGFTEAYNQMRLGFMAGIESKCGNLPIIIAGYSRGGAILNLLAFSLREENIIPASRITLITYGSPRVLEDSTSDKLHNDAVKALRLVYKKDPVPSLPYGWMGVKHAGEMICNACGYSEGRDKPGFGWPQDQHFHTKYSEWFPLL